MGSNFDKIAEIVETRNKTQVRAFYNTEVKRINSVLAPLGVQVDPADSEEVHTAMHNWHCMKEKLGPGGSFQELCKKPQDRNMFAWGLKKELDKSVWAEGKKEAKLKSLGLLPGGAGGVFDTGAAKKLGSTPVKTTANRGRPKGSSARAKNTCKVDSPASRNKAAARKAARRGGSASPNAAAVRAHTVAVTDNAPKVKEQKERLMLQLFPIDASTRAALVAGGFNPHLELTFRAKKSVTGLMQHLATKWAAALPHLPPGLDPKTSVLQLYPFEATSAAEATGAWNGRHEGVTATDIFDALGRPAAFRVRYGWVVEAEAAARPRLAPPPPPVHQASLARSRSRTPSPPNLSPRKRSAEEMAVAHPSFCQAPVQPGAFAAIFGGGGASGVPGSTAPIGSILGSDFTGDIMSFGGVGSGSAGIGNVGHNSVGVGGGVDDDFTLSGFGAGEFSKMCREMGFGDMETSRPPVHGDVGGGSGAEVGVVGLQGHGGMGVASVAPSAAGQAPAARETAPLVSAAPSEFDGYAQRQIISQFGAGNDSIPVAGLLEGDSMFSLTQMLGDVPNGTTAPSGQPVVGPTSFAGMFGGPLPDAMRAIGSGGATAAARNPAATVKPSKGKGEKKPVGRPKKEPTPVAPPSAANLMIMPKVSAPGMGMMVPGYTYTANGGILPVPVQQQQSTYYPQMIPHGGR